MSETSQKEELAGPVDRDHYRITRVIQPAVAPLVIFAVALGIGLTGVNQTGPLWSDSARYSNAAAMIHDWLISGSLLTPYQFALQNYVQYPAFSMPYHPPVFPGVVALVFLWTGTSYVAARAFVAVSLGIAGYGFFGIQRRFQVTPWLALGSSLLFLTTPDVSRWGRDTMSEVPSLAVFFLATHFFLRWTHSRSRVDCWVAFGVAFLSFLCRVTTVGLIPGWLVYAWILGGWRSLRSFHLIAALVLYLLGVGAYVKVVARFNQYEVAADGHGEYSLLTSLEFFAFYVPRIAYWGSTLAGLLGLAWLLARGFRSPVGRFWLSWLLSYTAFKLIVLTSHETRHFFAAIPALAGFAVCVGGDRGHSRFGWLASTMVGLGLMINLCYLPGLPRGIVGYSTVAASLATQTRSGNVLLACPYDQELMFRYRCLCPDSRRMMLRGDRTLAIRAPVYARVAAEIRATQSSDVLDIIQQGRVRYLVTADRPLSSIDDRPAEMVLAHKTALERPDAFTLISQHPLLQEIDRSQKTSQVYVWEYQGHLPDGASSLPTIIPTAGMNISPKMKVDRAVALPRLP